MAAADAPPVPSTVAAAEGADAPAVEQKPPEPATQAPAAERAEGGEEKEGEDQEKRTQKEAAAEAAEAADAAEAAAFWAQWDAPVVSRLRAAGAVIIGRTNMVEFAFGGVGLNPHFGTPKNPYDRE